MFEVNIFCCPVSCPSRFVFRSAMSTFLERSILCSSELSAQTTASNKKSTFLLFVSFLYSTFVPLYITLCLSMCLSMSLHVSLQSNLWVYVTICICPLYICLLLSHIFVFPSPCVFQHLSFIFHLSSVYLFIYVPFYIYLSLCFLSLAICVWLYISLICFSLYLLTFYFYIFVFILYVQYLYLYTFHLVYIILCIFLYFLLTISVKLFPYLGSLFMYFILGLLLFAILCLHASIKDKEAKVIWNACKCLLSAPFDETICFSSNKEAKKKRRK